MRVSVIGAGIAGLTCALELAERGVEVELLERAAQLGAGGCSWYAGGMLAPWCERESSPPLITRLGIESLRWWREHFPGTVERGTLPSVYSSIRVIGRAAKPGARRTVKLQRKALTRASCCQTTKN